MVSKKKIKYRIFCIKRDMGVRLRFLAEFQSAGLR